MTFYNKKLFAAAGLRCRFIHVGSSRVLAAKLNARRKTSTHLPPRPAAGQSERPLTTVITRSGSWFNHDWEPQLHPRDQEGR